MTNLVENDWKLTKDMQQDYKKLSPKESIL